MQSYEINYNYLVVIKNIMDVETWLFSTYYQRPYSDVDTFSKKVNVYCVNFNRQVHPKT